MSVTGDKQLHCGTTKAASMMKSSAPHPDVVDVRALKRRATAVEERTGKTTLIIIKPTACDEYILFMKMKLHRSITMTLGRPSARFEDSRSATEIYNRGTARRAWLCHLVTQRKAYLFDDLWRPRGPLSYCFAAPPSCLICLVSVDACGTLKCTQLTHGSD